MLFDPTAWKVGTWTRLAHEKLGKSKVVFKGTCRGLSRWMGSGIRWLGLEVGGGFRSWDHYADSNCWHGQKDFVLFRKSVWRYEI